MLRASVNQMSEHMTNLSFSLPLFVSMLVWIIRQFFWIIRQIWIMLFTYTSNGPLDKNGKHKEV